MSDVPAAEERPQLRGIDSLRSVCHSLEDWSKELGVIAGFERMAHAAMAEAGIIRAAITTVSVDLDTLGVVRRFLKLPDSISRPGLYSRLIELQQYAEAFTRGVESYEMVEGPDGDLARLKLENARLRIELKQLKGIEDGDAEPVRGAESTAYCDRPEGAETATA